MDPPLSWSNRMQKNASSFPPSLPLMICVNGCAIITANILDLQIRAIIKKTSNLRQCAYKKNIKILIKMSYISWEYYRLTFKIFISI